MSAKGPVQTRVDRDANVSCSCAFLPRCARRVAWPSRRLPAATPSCVELLQECGASTAATVLEGHRAITARMSCVTAVDAHSGLVLLSDARLRDARRSQGRAC